MSTTFESRCRVLFVDDDPRFRDMIRRLMEVLSQGRWEIFVAESASEALVIIQEHPIHLVVIDVQMPVVDGLQFLTLLNRRHPNVQKAVLTGYATEAYRAACLSNGAELFLEKPKSPGEQESLFATLNELMKWRPEEGFQRVLRRVGLEDVIQMECLGGNSSVLQVKAKQGEGKIFIKDGAILHAEAGDRKGEAAFNFLLALQGGEFWLRPFVEPPEVSLHGSGEFLLMEAARLRDEAGDAETPEAEPQSAAGAGPELPPPQAAAADVSRWAEPAASVSAEAQVVAAASPDQAEERQGARTVIDEVFLCSAEGEVLYEWQCRDSDLWIKFLEFVSQTSQRLGQGLPLGPLDRLEIRGPKSRIVTRISPDGGLLVRSRKEPA